MSGRWILIATIAVAISAVLYQKYSTSKTRNERRAWLTLLGTEDYLPGVLALARSLKRAKTVYPLVVMVNEHSWSEETQQLILNEGCSVRFIDDLHPTSAANIAYERYSETWQKLRAFEMVDVCDRCVFMDADIIVIRNMDELFDSDASVNFAAVQTCTCNLRQIPTFPAWWKRENCFYTDEQHASAHKHDGLDKYAYFNSGLFVFHPNLTVFQQMMQALDTWNLTEFIFPDQDFLNKFYHQSWTRLPFIYNAVKVVSKSHPNVWNLSEIKAIHYVLAKPWNKSDKDYLEYESINQLWWEAYEYV